MNEFIRIALAVDSSSLQKGLATATTAVSVFKKTLAGIRAVGDQVDSVLKGIGARAAAMSGTLTATMVASGAAAQSFETRMRNVNSISKESEAQFRSAGNQILDMSRKMPIAANVMADGLYDLASSGFAGAEGMEILGNANMAATAGMTDTAVAAKGIAAVLNAYSIDASHAADVSDILFKTVDVGVITFEDLVHQLGDFVPLGQAVGLEFDQMAAGIAALTRGGFPAAQAATALAGAIRAFVKPSEAMQAAVKKQGYASASAMLEARGLQGAIEDLTNSVNDDAEAIGQLFQDTEGLRGVLSLTANEGATFSEAMASIANETNRAGATEAAYAEQSKATSVQLKLFFNALTGLRIEIGQYYLPIFGELLQRGASFLGLVSDLPGPIKAGAAAFIAIGQVITAFVGLLLLASVRSKVFSMALKNNSLAMKLGISNAKSFSGVILGLSRRMDIAGKAAKVMGTSMKATSRTWTIMKSPIGVVGDGLFTLGNRFGTAGKASGTFSARMAAAGASMSNFAARTGTLGARLTTLSGRFAFASRSARGLVTSLKAVRAALPSLGTTVMAGLMIWEAYSGSVQKAKDSVTELYDEISAEFDTTTIEGRTKAIDELINKHEEFVRRSDNTDDFGSTVQQAYELANPLAANSVTEAQAAAQRSAEYTQEMIDANNRAIQTMNLVRRATGLTQEEVESLAKSLGLDLTKGLTVADLQAFTLTQTVGETEQSFIEALAATDSVAGALVNAALAAGDGKFQISLLGEQLKGINSPIRDIIGLTIELTDAQKALKSAMEEIGSASTAWSEALSAKKDERSKIVEDELRQLEKESQARIDAAEEAAQARQDAIDDEIEALREADTAENDTAGAVKAAEDRKTSARRSSQTELEALREREAEILRQQREDLQATVDAQVLTLGEYATALDEQNRQLAEWQQNTVLVAGRTSEDVAQFIASMGEEGVELMALMATGSDEEVSRMKDEIVENMKLTGEESAVKLSAGMTIAATAAEQGAQATRDAILDELGLLPGDMDAIMRDFGDSIEAGINRILVGLGEDPIELNAQIVVPPGWQGPVPAGTVLVPLAGPPAPAPVAKPYTGPPPGGVRPMALGGIGRPGDGVMFNEPGTGGEAYIPLGMGNRDRSRKIWAETGRLLGVTGMAAGGIMGFSSPSIITQDHSTKIEKRSETRFTGDMYLSDPKATIAYAERRKRLAALRGDN